MLKSSYTVSSTGLRIISKKYKQFLVYGSEKCLVRLRMCTIIAILTS